MADYTPAEIVDMLLILGECHGNSTAAERRYAEVYPNRRHPNAATIMTLKRRAQNGHLRRQRRHHEYDVNDVRVLVVLALIHMDPHISSRQIVRESGIPKTTVLRILRVMKYHPYHITLTQALTPNDMLERVRFCQWALQMIQLDPDFFRFVLFSDEATFKSDGSLNRHNCHYWSDQNPHWYRPVDHQHRWSINVWCGIVNGCLVGPYFFEQNVTGVIFLEFLRNHLHELLEDVDLVTRQRLWIQLDGAPPHFARVVRDFLNEEYPHAWIGRGGPVAWPARSPDLTSPDFYLWGYLKNIVYQQQPTTRDNMMQRIREACAAIPRNVLLNTVRQFETRLGLCIAANGGNFEQMINS